MAGYLSYNWPLYISIMGMSVGSQDLIQDIVKMTLVIFPLSK